MGDRDDSWAGNIGFGNSFLTPGQELQESFIDAPRRGIEARNWNNPLAQRDAAVLAAAAARDNPQVSAAPAAVAPNPLVKPPAPLTTMPIAQQMAWQQYNATALKEQGDLAKQALQQKIAQRQEEERVEAYRQATKLMDRTIELDPSDKNYPLQRAKLARDHPLGAMTAEGQKAFEHFDRQYQQRTELETHYMKADEATRQTEDRQRLQAARKQAEELGPDAYARFLEREKTDREAAITGVAQEAAGIRRAEIQARLQASGMPVEQIEAKFGGGATGRPFLYGAAEAETKVRMTPAQEAANTRSMYVTLLKERKDAGGYDPNEPNPDWPEERENIFQNVEAAYNALLNRGNRGGVGGMTDRQGPQRQGGQPLVVTPPASASPPTVSEKRIINPKTGETMVLRNGKWVKI